MDLNIRLFIFWILSYLIISFWSLNTFQYLLKIHHSRLIKISIVRACETKNQNIDLIFSKILCLSCRSFNSISLFPLFQDDMIASKITDKFLNVTISKKKLESMSNWKRKDSRRIAKGYHQGPKIIYPPVYPADIWADGFTNYVPRRTNHNEKKNNNFWPSGWKILRRMIRFLCSCTILLE